MAPVSVLPALQRQLQSVYELEVAHCVTDFLITDAAAARRLHASQTARESLLLRQHGEALDLALYVDDSVLATLAAHDPFVALHDGNLNDFLIALEGVSHFLCVAWSAAWERQVTPLELELQAEIDKFVVLRDLIGSRRGDGIDLMELLFGNPVFDPALDGRALQRYRDANQLAARYCQQLASRYHDAGPPDALVTELRRFYRLARSDKLRRIQAD